MSALYKLQHSFAADIWDEEMSQLDGVILDGRLPAERLLQVYRNNYWISAEDALADIYSVVKQLVGSQFFAFLTDRFLRSYPLRQGNLHHLGDKLATFLEGFTPVANLTYLPDIARLELAYHQVFHAAGGEPVDSQALEGIAPDRIMQLHFKLATSSRLVCSSFPIFDIWRVNQAGYEGDQHVDLTAGGESVLLTRMGLEVELQQLDQANSGFIKYLMAGHNLAEAAEAILKNSNDFDFATALARYLVSGVLIPGNKDQTSQKSGQLPVVGPINYPGEMQP